MGSLKSRIQSKRTHFSLFVSLSFIFLAVFFIVANQSYKPKTPGPRDFLLNRQESCESSRNCTGVRVFAEYESRCRYVKSHSSCSGDGYLDYLEIFYCSCGGLPVLGYTVLLLWLVVLFYVLGNTTAEYFCPSVEYLSKVLKLSPTIAGTTLLPLGNGANDVFSSVISFTRSGAGDVGLNSVLGGALFISCFVVGVVSISISSRQIRVEKSSFIRDVLFFLFTLCCLLLIVIFGRVNLWIALCFVCIYFIYIAVVCAMHFFSCKKERVVNSPILDDFGSLAVPLLGDVDQENGYAFEKDSCRAPESKSGMRFLNVNPSCCLYWNWIVYIIELLLFLPMRLTIPVITEEKWSKPFAISSVTLAPILLAALWSSQGEEHDAKICLAIYISAAVVGIILGNLAFFFTEKSSPPDSLLLPWLAGGFLMSITWTYILVEELVSLLVAFANILGISPSILGLTVLAWGNSVGDLVSNLAMALKGGADGAQVAMSGCYAGPVFNTLMGLGVSLALASWEQLPDVYILPTNDDVYETLEFLMGGLLWALVILPKRNMELDRCLGIGLLAIYLCFLCLRLAKSVTLFQFNDSP